MKRKIEALKKEEEFQRKLKLIRDGKFVGDVN